jgi:DNA-binding CsgD family transcriptional regulator
LVPNKRLKKPFYLKKPHIFYEDKIYIVDDFYISELGYLMMRILDPTNNSYHNHALNKFSSNDNVFIELLDNSLKNNDHGKKVNTDQYIKKLNSIVEIEKTFPQLTVKERKLCAFLVVDKSTAEISKATGQSIHTLTVARYRIRKKIGIPKSAELNAYLRQQLDLI